VATHRPTLTRYLQVLKLCGPEPLTIPLVLAVVGLQCTCAYLLSNTPFWSWRFWLTAYIIGATANQNLFLAIHEISHNLAFKSGLANRLLAIVANLPIGIPYSASFRVRLLECLGNGQSTDICPALPLDPP
jgi:sphingolipid delta-4 desaturase